MPGDFDWGDIGTPGPDDFSDPMGDGGFDWGGVGTPGPDMGDPSGGFSDVFSPWGDQDLGEFMGSGGAPGMSGGGAGGLMNGLKKLFGGKDNKGMDAMAFLAALLGGGLMNRNQLAGSDEMKGLLQSQKKRMDLQDPLFNAATRTAFGLLPTASREGLSIDGWGAPAQPQAPAAPEAPRSANLDSLGYPLRQGNWHVNPGGNLGRLKR